MISSTKKSRNCLNSISKPCILREIFCFHVLQLFCSSNRFQDNSFSYPCFQKSWITAFFVWTVFTFACGLRPVKLVVTNLRLCSDAKCEFFFSTVCPISNNKGTVRKLFVPIEIIFHKLIICVSIKPFGTLIFLNNQFSSNWSTSSSLGFGTSVFCQLICCMQFWHIIYSIPDQKEILLRWTVFFLISVKDVL